MVIERGIPAVGILHINKHFHETTVGSVSVCVHVRWRRSAGAAFKRFSAISSKMEERLRATWECADRSTRPFGIHSVNVLLAPGHALQQIVIKSYCLRARSSQAACKSRVLNQQPCNGGAEAERALSRAKPELEDSKDR